LRTWGHPAAWLVIAIAADAVYAVHIKGYV
jgi:hypothetical protein